MGIELTCKMMIASRRYARCRQTWKVTGFFQHNSNRLIHDISDTTRPQPVRTVECKYR